MAFGRTTPYERAGIFPWGRSAQTGPDGEPVVSSRAIKHVDCLAAAARSGRARAAVLFVVLRADAARFRPNADACPSFARHLRAARDAGVRVIAQRVRWTADGRAFSEGELEVILPEDGA